MGASLSAEALLGEPFLGIRKDMGWRAQGTDITLHGGPTGEFVGGSSGGDLRRLWIGEPSPTEALLRIMGLGGTFARKSERWMKGSSGNVASLSMGAL